LGRKASLLLPPDGFVVALSNWRIGGKWWLKQRRYSQRRTILLRTIFKDNFMRAEMPNVFGSSYVKRSSNNSGLRRILGSFDDCITGE
jgi:hypothetical protein